MNPVVVIGDVFLDRDIEGEVARFVPDAPVPVVDETGEQLRPGGAGLSATLAAADGREVVLVTAFAHDAAGEELERLLQEAGVRVVNLGTETRTGEKIRLRGAGQILARLDRGTAGTGPYVGTWPAAAREALASARALLVSCYGRGLTAASPIRAAIEAVADDRPVVWDPHPRGPRPVGRSTVVTPNAAELAGYVPEHVGEGLESVTVRASALVNRWRVRGVAVTLGARGALLSTGDGLPLVVPAVRTADGDACGAGDRFAASTTAHLADGALLSEAVTAAVDDATRFVAAGGASAVRVNPSEALQPRSDDPFTLAADVRGSGGTVVATGGCFDLVHAGHIHLLEAARRLGDCLIVCLNSDASVRRLKGPERPVVPERDRAALLRALGCVDAVAVFDDDTPVPTLERLHPHVFAKGGDYGNARIPEVDAIVRWGGQAVTLPYLEGRSTTRIIKEARRHA